MFELPPCLYNIAEDYQIPPTLIMAIHKTEGGKPGSVIGPNRNGSYDLGPMQINDLWLPELKEQGISREELINDACINIKVGAWILAKRYKEFDNSWIKAVKAYNAGYILSNGESYALKTFTYWLEILEKNKAQPADK
ncbi:lytic transglycosylase domain-containing protein [Pseudoalteromonas marina]|uniref:Lytic transglycosylase domain-containing protein n=1 Tax=Pseudoalteromonas marina TaxID=267375 RepID=A0ABT9FC60_9GAMM|nr:lytic transglycosylase domain-containing protein [Pseudoalteromonas marina]MDP2564373.1 lytic transglycosylase domain-containing protein [Pseudoalteromonas marina]